MRKKLQFSFSKVILLMALVTGMNMWGQATLPLTRTVWNSTPTGWTDSSGTPYLTSFACSGNNGAKFENTGNSFTVNFADTPDKLSFTFKSNNTNSTSVLLVQESSNGTDYTTVVSLTGNANIPNTCTTKGAYQLKPASRYVKWTFTKGSSNGTMDDVSITASPVPTVTSVAASSISASGATFNGTVSAASTNVTTSFEYGTTTSYGNIASNTTPSSVTGTTSTPFSAPVTGLAVNTQYHFRAVGNNGTVYNGSDLTFYTLANVPASVAIDNPGVYTLNVTLDGVSVNSNPAYTQFAIQETGGQYVQANGSLGASPYWATADNWQNKTVTGLSAATTYTFHAKARNGANVETSFGATAQEVTLPNTSPLLYADTLASFTTPVGSTATNMATIFGDNLTTEDVTVGPLAGFTFSTTLEGTYTNTLTFTQPGNSFSEEFYVKFTPVAVQSYSGNLPVSGGGASTINIAVTATGVAPTAALSGTLGEASLNGASFTVTLSNGTFNNPLTAADFTLNGAPAGVTLAGVTYISPTTATLVLAYDDTDFDSTPSISVTIAPSQTTSNLQITSGTLSITPVIESIVSNGTLSFTPQVCINQTADSSLESPVL